MPGEGAPRRDPTSVQKAAILPGEERHDKIVGVDPGVPASAKGPMFGTGQQAGYNAREERPISSSGSYQEKSASMQEEPLIRQRKVVEQKKVIEERPIGEVNGQEVDLVTKRTEHGPVREQRVRHAERPIAGARVRHTISHYGNQVFGNKRLASMLLLGLLLLPAAWWFANRMFAGPMHVPVHHVEHKEVHHESKGGLINDLTAKAKDVLSDTKLTTESLTHKAKEMAKDTAHMAKETASDMIRGTKTYRAITFGDRLWNVWNRITHPFGWQKYETERYEYLEKNYPGRVEVTHSRDHMARGFIGRFFGNLFGRILPLMLLGLLALSTVPLYFYFRKRGLPGRNILARRGIVANAPAQHRVPVVAQQAVPAGVAQPVGYTSVSQMSTKPIVNSHTAELKGAVPAAATYTQQPIAQGAPIQGGQQGGQYYAAGQQQNLAQPQMRL